MKREITRLDVRSVALMAGAVMVLISLVFALLAFLIISTTAFNASFSSLRRNYIFGSGALMLIFIPIIYGIIGIIFGALSAVLYNFIAGRIGGVKIYIRE